MSNLSVVVNRTRLSRKHCSVFWALRCGISGMTCDFIGAGGAGILPLVIPSAFTMSPFVSLYLQVIHWRQVKFFHLCVTSSNQFRVSYVTTFIVSRRLHTQLACYLNFMMCCTILLKLYTIRCSTSEFRSTYVMIYGKEICDRFIRYL